MSERYLICLLCLYSNILNSPSYCSGLKFYLSQLKCFPRNLWVNVILTHPRAKCTYVAKIHKNRVKWYKVVILVPLGDSYLGYHIVLSKSSISNQSISSNRTWFRYREPLKLGYTCSLFEPCRKSRASIASRGSWTPQDFLQNRL